MNKQTNIFISYRRADTAGHTGRLYDRLKQHFGDSGQIFMDLDTIAPGQDFAKVIEQSVGSCQAIVVMIGDQWPTIKDQQGQPRLMNPGDYVRNEVALALRRGILVIPVLVEGAPMPNAGELPPDLDSLPRLNALEISDGRWEHDTQKLIQTLERELGLKGAPKEIAMQTTSGFSMKKMMLLGAAVLALLLAVVIGRAIFGSKTKTTEVSQKEAAPAVKTQPPVERVENKTVPVQVNTIAASIPASAPQPVSEKINLLDPKQGGKLIIASRDSWKTTTDGDTYWHAVLDSSDFAVFAFKDEKVATFDTFTLFIPSTSNGNPKEFELFVGSNSPEGPLTSLGKFQAKNYRVVQNPFQEFKFPEVKARYLKVVFHLNHANEKSFYVHELSTGQKLGTKL